MAKNHFSAAISLHQAIFQKSCLPINDFYFMEMNFPKSFQTNALSSFHAWICDSLTKRSFLFLVFDSLSFSIVLTFGDLLKLWTDLNSTIDKFLEIFKNILQSNCNGYIWAVWNLLFKFVSYQFFDIERNYFSQIYFFTR